MFENKKYHIEFCSKCGKSIKHFYKELDKETVGENYNSNTLYIFI